MTRPRARIGRHLIGIDNAGDRVTKHDLLVVDTVPANQCNPILVYSLQSAAHDLSQDRWIDAFLRKAGDGHGCDWRAGHRPHVVDRIQRRDATVVVRVVNDGSEEIERLDEREVVAKTVYSRVDLALVQTLDF